jgi:hypothetical protein
VLHSDLSLFKLLPANVLQIKLLHSYLLRSHLRRPLHHRELRSPQPHRDDLLLHDQCVCNGMFATMHASLLRKPLVFKIGSSREEVP